MSPTQRDESQSPTEHASRVKAGIDAAGEHIAAGATKRSRISSPPPRRSGSKGRTIYEKPQPGVEVFYDAE